MKSLAVMFLAALLFGTGAEAADAKGQCQVPPIASGTEESLRELRYFFDRVLDKQGKRDLTCCAGSPSAPLLPLCMYLNEQSKKLPLQKEVLGRSASEWVWRWDGVIQKTGGRADLPNGFASAFIESISLRVARDPGRLETLLDLYRHADGVYAQEIGEHVVELLKSQPGIFTARCTVVTRNVDVIARAVDLYPEVRPELRRTYSARQSDKRCPALEKLFKPE